MPTAVRRPVMEPLKRLRSGLFLPPPWWRPYPQSSMWKPIPGTEDGTAGNPSIHGSSAAFITKLTGWGNPAQIIVAQDSSSTQTFPSYNHPTYFGGYNDPVFEVRMRTGGNTSPYWTTSAGPLFRCPQAAKPAGGTPADPNAANIDAHMAIIQPDGTEWFIYDVWKNQTGTLQADRLGVLPTGGGIIYGTGLQKSDLKGDGVRIGADGTATAAAVASLYGQIRPEEMITTRSINHALFMVARSSDGTHVAPAVANAGTSDPTNAPPCGARFQLNMTQTDIDAIADSGNSSGRWWNKALLTAMRKYGMYFLDTSGASWGIELWSGMSQYALTGVDPWRTWAAATSPAMTYSGATDDVYFWDIRTLRTWSSVLRVLDWTDPLNH